MRFFLAHNGVDVFIYNPLQTGESINYGQPYLEYFDSEEALILRLGELGQTFIPRTYYISYNNDGAMKYGLLTDDVNIYEYSFLEYFATETEMRNRITLIIHNKQNVAWNDTRTLALHKEYPYLTNTNYKLIQLDNLEGMRREIPISDRGLKGEKKYYKGDTLIWSSEKKYWFQDETIDGFVRIIKLYSVSGDVMDTWQVIGNLSSDDKQLFNKRRRELIFEYLKGRQPELFNLVYGFFTQEVNDYVMVGGDNLRNVLIDAKDNHPAQIVRDTLSLVVQTPSGANVTVLDGVLAELI